MKSLSIARQFMILVLAFGIAAFGSVCGLAWVFYRNAATARDIASRSALQTDALFSLVESVGQVQTTVQRLLREKDPDNIESLMDQAKAAGQKASDHITAAGAGGGNVASEFASLKRSNDESAGFLLKGDFARAQEILIEQSNPAFERLLAAVGTLEEAAGKKNKEASAAAEAASRRAQYAIFLVAGLVLAGLIAMGIAAVRRISTTLARTVSELSAAFQGTASAAAQIANTSNTLAQGASEQAASLEQTSASSEEISTMTAKNAEHCRLAAEKMNGTAAQIGDANTRLVQMVTSMNEINASSGEISKIIRVIDEIAFQTNILALNAAVEAARAGEAGMGFAVVADEVRNLAQRCAQAARDTARLIEDSIRKTREGKTRLDEVAGVFRFITESTEDVKQRVDEVRTASQEQSRGIHQISTALSQMEQVTRRNAASAEHSASAGETLNSHSVTLEAAVGVLTAMVNGATARAGR